MPEFRLGMNAKVFMGAEDAALAILDELSNVKDVTLDVTTGEADVTTRANSGWSATAPTLKAATATFQMQWKPTDALYDTIRTAFLTEGLLSMAFLTGALSTADSDGPYGNWGITGWSRSEPLEGAIVVDVTAKLAAFDAWIKDGAE